MYDEGYPQHRGSNRRGSGRSYQGSSGYRPRMGNSFGNVLLMDAYQAVTHKGSRKNLWIIGVIASGYGVVKLTQFGGRALTKGARHSINLVKSKQIKQQQRQLELEYEKDNQQPMEKAASMVELESKTEPEAYEVPFITRLTQRIESEPGVSFIYELQPLKKGEDERQRKLKVKLGKDELIQVNAMGMFDKEGEPLLEADLTRSIVTILSRYPKKYERGLLIILDEFAKIGKVLY